MSGWFTRLIASVFGSRPLPTSSALMVGALQQGDAPAADAHEHMLRRAMQAASQPEPSMTEAAEPSAGTSLPSEEEAPVYESADAALPDDLAEEVELSVEPLVAADDATVPDELESVEPEAFLAPIEEVETFDPAPNEPVDEPLEAAETVMMVVTEEDIVSAEAAPVEEPSEPETLTVETAEPEISAAPEIAESVVAADEPVFEEAAPAKKSRAKKGGEKKAAEKKTKKKAAPRKRKAAPSDAASADSERDDMQPVEDETSDSIEPAAPSAQATPGASPL